MDTGVCLRRFFVRMVFRIPMKPYPLTPAATATATALFFVSCPHGTELHTVVY